MRHSAISLATAAAMSLVLVSACGTDSAGSAQGIRTVTAPGKTVTAPGTTVIPPTATTTATVTATRTGPADPPETVVITSTVEITVSAPVEDEVADPPTTSPATADDAASASAPLAESAAEPITLSGTGDDVVDVELTDAMVLTFQCPECTSNTALIADGADGLLVNEIGAYAGRHLVNLSSDLTHFEVNADGSWTITIDPTTVLADDPNRQSGHGDDVVYYDSGSKATISHSGESNFAVTEYSSSGGRNLLVNEIGQYNGTVPLNTPSIVQVNADGDWTIEPS